VAGHLPRLTRLTGVGGMQSDRFGSVFSNAGRAGRGLLMVATSAPRRHFGPGGMRPLTSTWILPTTVIGLALAITVVGVQRWRRRS
jgi:hypothetical protein